MKTTYSSTDLDSSLNVREISVTDLSCGSISNFGGGLLLKLQLAYSTIRCVALTPEPTFRIRDAFDAQTESPWSRHSELKRQAERSKDRHAPLAISEHDYQSLKKTSIVAVVNIYPFKKVTVTSFIFHSGVSEIYIFNARAREKLALLLEEHHTAGNLVDTRTIRKMSSEEVEEHLASLPGYRLNNLFIAILRSKNIVDKNHVQLDNHLQKFDGYIDNPDFTDWNLRHRKELYLDELLRLLHNFVASCGSLIAHHRKIVKNTERKYRKIPNYEAELKNHFAGDLLSQFIKDFRNFLMHNGLPSVTMRSELSENGVSGSVFLKTEDLLRWREWKSDAKHFIRSQEPELNLREVTRGYFKKISSFYKWFELQYYRTFWKEINEWDKKQQAAYLDIGLELNENLRQALAQSDIKDAKALLGALSERCSPEELDELHNLLDSPQDLVKSAIGLTAGRFPLPGDIEKKLFETAKAIEAARNSKFKHST